MSIIFYEWKYLTQQIFSSKSLNFAQKLFFNYLKSIKSFLIYFGWLIFIDVTLFIFFDNYLLKAINFLLTNNKESNFIYPIIALLVISIWFILPSNFLLTIRREGDINWYYLKTSFLRYLQLKVILSCIFFIVFNLITLMGIKIFPTQHWLLGLSIKLVELITILFWLDSCYRLVDIFYSIERAINFIIYQCPFFIVLSIIWLPINLMLTSLCNGFQIKYHFFRITTILEIAKSIEVVADKLSISLKIKFLLFRYFIFFINFFFVAFVYTFYAMKKRKIFTQSIIVENINLD